MTVRLSLTPLHRQIFQHIPDNELTLDYVWHTVGSSQNPFLPDTTLFVEYYEKIQSFNQQIVAPYLQAPEVVPYVKPSKRRLPQPVFKPRFDTLHDSRMRLQGSCIFIGSSLYYVREVYDHDGDYLLYLSDKSGKQWRCGYNKCDAIDLRSAEPQYVNSTFGTMFVFRQQARGQRQGMHTENMVALRPGSSELNRVPTTDVLLQGIGDDPCPWSPHYATLMSTPGVMPTLRLSRHLALFTKKDKIVAEYKTRPIGTLHDNEIHLSSTDYAKPWLRRAIQDVNCVPRETK